MTYSETAIATVALREYGGVGPKTFQALMARYGTPQNVFAAPTSELAGIPRMTTLRARQIEDAASRLVEVRDRLDDYRHRGISLTTVFDEDYPESLLEITGPPPVLYFRGKLDLAWSNCVAIVGSHEASSEAIAEGVRLGQRIGETGTIVVSGLARGVDSAAHIGTLKAEGTTVAVLGSGFDEIYPPENDALAEQIAQTGLLLSEYAPETPVSTGRLLARNRIIVGLSRSTIVVEITEGSGGTAEAIVETINQGKALFTYFNPNHSGETTNKLGAIQLAGKDDWKMVIRYMV